MPNAKQIITYSMIVFWIAFAFNELSSFGENVGLFLHWAGLVILVVHVVELAVVYKKLKAINHGSAKDIISVLAFGIVFWKPLLSK